MTFDPTMSAFVSKLYYEEREAFDDLLKKVNRSAARYSWRDYDSMLAYKEHWLNKMLLASYKSRHGEDGESTLTTTGVSDDTAR